MADRRGERVGRGLGLSAATRTKSPLADRLTKHLRAGTLLDLIPNRPAVLLDEGEMRAWDASHDLDADVLRELLRGRVVTDPDPRGLQLRGARIRGRLDLDHLTAVIPLALADCLLEAGITAVGAHLPQLMLLRCRLGHPSKPALFGDLLRVDRFLALRGSVLAADTERGAVRLPGARIDGQLSCSGATLSNPSGPASNRVGHDLHGVTVRDARLIRSDGWISGTSCFRPPAAVRSYPRPPFPGRALCSADLTTVATAGRHTGHPATSNPDHQNEPRR